MLHDQLDSLVRPCQVEQRPTRDVPEQTGHQFALACVIHDTGLDFNTIKMAVVMEESDTKPVKGADGDRTGNVLPKSRRNALPQLVRCLITKREHQEVLWRDVACFEQ